MEATRREELLCIEQDVEIAEPRQIIIGHRGYFLCRDQDGAYLLSNVCPHRGGRIRKTDEGCFECPLHGWEFDRSGKSTNVASQKLARIPLIEIDGMLYIERNLGLQSEQDVPEDPSLEAKPDFELHLHAHACVELIHDGFSLLTDPWLDGPAFFGSWIQYPKPIVSGADLEPSAIWISHEHSDHLHVPTLRQFKKSTPCYFPDFPNRRIERQLAALGFTQLHPMKFGESYQLAPGFEIASFAPQSLWNDSIGMFSIEGFNILNLNDAGINHTIAKSLPPIDLLMSVFSGGASCFPVRLRGISDEEKISHYERGKIAALDTLLHVAETYRAKAVMPIASFFNSWHPANADYRRMAKKNSVIDVVRHFENTGIEVIDLHPGELWKCRAGEIDRKTTEIERRSIFEFAAVASDAEERFDEMLFAEHYPSGSITQSEFERYLTSLNDTPDLQFAGTIGVSVFVLDQLWGDVEFDVHFNIDDGELSLRGSDSPPDLRIWIPKQVLASIVHDGSSWDEATVSCWCELEQVSGKYTPGFWRAIQAPYYCRRPEHGRRLGVRGAPERFAIDMPIQEALDVSPHAERILRRYGLSCMTCGKAHLETLKQGAVAHGLTDESTDRMLNELNRTALGLIEPHGEAGDRRNIESMDGLALSASDD